MSSSISVYTPQIPSQILYYGNFARNTSMSSGGTTSDNLIAWDTTNLSRGMSLSGTDASKIVIVFVTDEAVLTMDCWFKTWKSANVGLVMLCLDKSKFVTCVCSEVMVL